MRISDWSSDVCSSDLIGVVGVCLSRAKRPYLIIVGSVRQRFQGHDAFIDQGIIALRLGQVPQFDVVVLFMLNGFGSAGRLVQPSGFADRTRDVEGKRVSGRVD